MLSNAYLLKLDSDGTFVWGGQLNEAVVQQINFDAVGGLILGVEIRDTIDVDPGQGIQLLPPSPGVSSEIVIRLKSDGNFDWVRQLGNLKVSTGHFLPMHVDAESNIYIASGFYDTLDLNPSILETFNVVHSTWNPDDYDVFVLKWSQPDLLVSVLEEDSKSNEVEIYPNPTRNHLFVNAVQNHISSISVTDMLGKQLLNYPVKGKQQIQLDLSAYQKGVYLVEVELEDGGKEVRRLVIQR